MTEQEFIEKNPTDYGYGIATLLVDGYTLYGANFPLVSKNGVEVSTRFSEIESLRINLNGDIRSVTITEKQNRGDYYYFRLQPIVLNSLPVSAFAGLVTMEENGEIFFIPYLQLNFRTGNNNPLIGNATRIRTSTYSQKVDRSSTYKDPTNLSAIISQSAEMAEIQDYFFTRAGGVNSKYRGSKIIGTTTVGDSPALSFKSFKGKIHLVGATNDVLKSGSADVIEQDIYFNITSSAASFPYQSGSNVLYTEDGNNLVPLVSSKVLVSEKNTVYTTNELGVIISEQ